MKRRDLLMVFRTRAPLELEGRPETGFGMPPRLAENGERVAALRYRPVDLASGRCGLVEGAGELVLIPWRPDLEHRPGLEPSGRVRTAGLGWTTGRGRGPGMG